MYPNVLTNLGKKRDTLANLSSCNLYKDLLCFQGIRKLELLDRLLLALAFQVGSQVNLDEIGRTIHANKIAVVNYIDLLEKVFIIYRRQPFNRNLWTEIGSNRKIYFYDNGIRNTIIGNLSPVSVRNDIGALWKNFWLPKEKIVVLLWLLRPYLFWRMNSNGTQRQRPRFQKYSSQRTLL